MANYDNKGIKGSRLERLVTKILTKIVGLDGDALHKAGSETITGLKTFNNAVSPRQTGDGFMKQSKVFIGSVITPYADWTASQKDGNHYRTWTIDLTSVIVASITHGNIVVKMMGSYYNTPGNGTLVKEITFQIYNGNVVITKGDYTVAQAPCSDEFAISDVFKSGSNYVIQVVNRNPTANNYPLRLEIEMFNRYASAVLDNVTLAESITEGLPSWAVDVAQVTADRAVTLDSKWYYYNASSTSQWLKVLSVVHTNRNQSYAGDLFAVASRDAGDNNCQSLLTVSSFSYGSTTLEAKQLVLGMRTTGFGDPVFYIYRQDETHYTLYVYLTQYSGVKIAPVICGGAITYEEGSYATQPANTAPIDRFVNIFTSSGAGIGGPLLPTYVDAKGLEVPCSSSSAVIGINLIGKNIGSFDTELTPIIPDYIYFPSQTDAISGYSLNIQRLVQGKVYKLMLRDGGRSVRVKLGNYHDGGPDTFEVHHGNASGRTVNWWELPDGTHGTSYTTHIVRVDNRTVYIIDGY